jgi:hypothetical protein
MIRTVFGANVARRRPIQRRAAPAPPSSSATASVAPRSASGRSLPRLELVAARPHSDGRTMSGRSTRTAGLAATAATAPRDTTRVPDALAPSARLAGTTGAAGRSPRERRGTTRNPEEACRAGVATGARGGGCTGATGPTGITESPATASGSAAAAGGDEAGAGAGGGATPSPVGPGGSAEPEAGGGRKSSGSRYPCSSAVLRIPR